MKKDKDENNETRGVYLKREFEMYKVWKSLPPMLKGKPVVNLRKFGIEDEDLLSLLQIKTQTEFAEHYGVGDLGTLTDWNKRIRDEGSHDDIHLWARQLTPNVMFALYKNIMKHGRAHEVRAWNELIEHQ